MKHKYYIDYFNKLKFLKFNFMQEFLESDAIWTFLLNAIGLISFGVGFWLIYKLVIFSINLRKNKKKNFNNYINLLKLPDRFQGLTQIHSKFVQTQLNLQNHKVFVLSLILFFERKKN